MLKPRDEDRRSLFTMLQTDRALADELIYLESTLDMLQDGIESFSMALDNLTENFGMFMDTVEEIDEKLNELVQSVEDRIHTMNEVNDLGNPEFPF